MISIYVAYFFLLVCGKVQDCFVFSLFSPNGNYLFFFFHEKNKIEQIENLFEIHRGAPKKQKIFHFPTKKKQRL